MLFYLRITNFKIKICLVLLFHEYSRYRYHTVIYSILLLDCHFYCYISVLADGFYGQNVRKVKFTETGVKKKEEIVIPAVFDGD